MFEYSNLKVSRFTDTYEKCPVCGLRYEVEPGFWYGAMFVSYSMSVALTIVVGMGVFILGNDPPLWVYLVAVTLALLIFVPFMFRYSRVLFLYLFSGVHYDPSAAR